MDQTEFRRLFAAALERAAEVAEQRLGCAVPRAFTIRLHGAGFAGDLLDPDTVADRLFLGDHLFYRVIDVAVVEVGERSTICFVRVSAHPPGSFEETWNTPPGSGPFKQLLSREITVVHPEAVSAGGA